MVTKTHQWRTKITKGDQKLPDVTKGHQILPTRPKVTQSEHRFLYLQDSGR